MKKYLLLFFITFNCNADQIFNLCLEYSKNTNKNLQINYQKQLPNSPWNIHDTKCIESTPRHIFQYSYTLKNLNFDINLVRNHLNNLKSEIKDGVCSLDAMQIVDHSYVYFDQYNNFLKQIDFKYDDCFLSKNIPKKNEESEYRKKQSQDALKLLEQRE